VQWSASNLGQGDKRKRGWDTCRSSQTHIEVKEKKGQNDSLYRSARGSLQHRGTGSCVGKKGGNHDGENKSIWAKGEREPGGLICLPGRKTGMNEITKGRRGGEHSVLRLIRVQKHLQIRQTF